MSDTRPGSPDDQESYQLMFHCVDVGNAHQVAASMTDDNHVPAYVEAPATVETIIRN